MTNEEARALLHELGTPSNVLPFTQVSPKSHPFTAKNGHKKSLETAILKALN